MGWSDSSNMSRMGLNIYTRMRLRGAARAKAEAQSVAKEFRSIDSFMNEIEGKQPQVRNWGLEALDVLSVVQMLRFAYKDFEELATGKFGFDDALSLATTLILLQYRLNVILQRNIAATATLNAMSLVTPGGISLKAAAAIVGGAAVVGGGLWWMREQQRIRERAELERREKISETILKSAEQRRKLTAARSIGVQ